MENPETRVERVGAGLERSEEIFEAFERQLVRARNRVYGIALFFEAIELLYAGQDDIIETYRERCRRVIRSGTAMLDLAEQLQRDASEGGVESSELGEFDFHFGEEQQDLLERAEALASAYDRLLPGRDRGRVFSTEERLRLLETASAS
jgi:hypothetical protein